jgi:Dodecin
MPKIVKVIEILSESPKSWEEAAQNVVAEASKTLRNIRSTFRLSSRFSAGLRPRVDRGGSCKRTRRSAPLHVFLLVGKGNCLSRQFGE